VPEDDEDAGASGPPPDPLDRLWFHPSELRSFLRAPTPTRRQRRRSALVGLAGALVVLTAVGLVVVSTTVDSGDNTGLPRGVDAFGGGAARVVAIAGASVVSVQATRGDGTTTTVSGICIDDDLVMTSAHALEDAIGVTVATSDNDDAITAVPAGVDPETDVALLRADSLSVPPATPSNSDGLRPGHDVLVVATGTQSKPRWVSTGNVGGLDEFVVTAAGTVVVGLFDTGTSAGRRHSGGAVLDERGQLVGIVTVPSATSSGLAMPMNTARDVVDQLAATGTATHAWLGITGTDDTDRAGGGALVAHVSEASPAEKAGLAPGDVIVAVGDGRSTTAVSGMPDLMAEVRARRPGHSLELTVLRDGAERHMPVALRHKTGPYDADVLMTTTTRAAPPAP
jgi:putative serine protease PepD